MRGIWVLTRNTFREAIRDRILYVLLLFALLMLGASALLGSLTIAQERKIVLDLGLGAIEVFGVAIAVFLGTSMLFKEIDKRTLYVVLSKPVPRGQFLVGKFLGLSLTLWVLTGLMGVGLSLLAIAHGSLTPELLTAVALIGVQLTLLVALTLFFSSFATPVMSMVFTASMYLIGHNTETLKTLAAKASPGVRVLAEGLYYVLPNLSTFDAKNLAVYGASFDAAGWAWALGYGLAYVTALLATAAAIFERREF